MVNKSELVIGIIIIFCLLISLSFIFATVMIRNPITLGNYTTTLNVSCNVSAEMAGSSASYNVSVYYNATGGANINSANLLYTMANTSAAQVVFENATVNITSLADGRNYNFSCYADNGSNQVVESVNITIDNTPPNVSSFANSNESNFNATNNWNYTNNANAALLAINVTVSDNIIGVNSVYFNFTFSNGTQKNFTKATAVGSYYYNMNISTFPDGAYYITAYANDTLNNLNKTERITVKLDKTAPVVTFVTGNRGNFSGTVKLNATVTDATIGVGDVYFNITNKTYGQHNFTKASKEGNTYNISLNTAVFPDGNYTLIVHSNDTQIANANNSESINFTIDNTAPNTPSFSCSPSQVYVGNSVTCTCSGTDATTGVNQTVYTVNPSTTNTGTFVVTCTTYDRAGNSNSATTSYVVEQGSSGSGGGGGTTTSFYTRTISRIEQEFSEIKTISQELREKQRVRVKISEEVHYVGVRAITATSATIEIASDPVQIILDIGEDAKVDVDDDNFYDIYVKLNSIKNGYADLTVDYLHEEIPEPEEGEVSSIETSGEIVEEEEAVEEAGIPIWVWIAAIVIVIAIVLGIVIWMKRS